MNVSSGQSPVESCPSHFSVPAGSAKVIDCDVELDNRYQWRSPDPSWLEYLSDVTLASPIFSAPDDILASQEFLYWRLSLGYEGQVLRESSVSITVYPTGSPPEDCREIDGCSAPERIENVGNLLEGKIRERQAPYLRCVSQVAVESGGMAEISCTGLPPSDELLTYRIEFDWPPYGETKIHEGGDFDYLVRVPLIAEPASVRNLEISAYTSGKEFPASQNVEVHITNKSPDLACEDIIVNEASQVTSPCSTTWKGDIQYQFISQPPLVQRGVYDQWPVFSVPEVHQDTSFAVTVRAFGANSRQVVEDEFTVMVRNTSTPFDLSLVCDPAVSELYEGAEPFEIRCIMDPPADRLTWIYSAEGNTPLELLELLGRLWFRFLVPETVEEDTDYEYSITVTVPGPNPDRKEDDSFADASIQIRILSKPDLFVTCENITVRTGDSPSQVCEVSNSKDLELTYDWNWMPSDGRLSSDQDGTLLFEVPEDQQSLIESYTYTDITVSAENAVLPETTEMVTITVIKDLGPLNMSCASPITVYEGSGDYPLDCSIMDLLTDNVVWSWQPQGNTEDLLRHGSDGVPVFQTPTSVPANTTYVYSIQVDAPPHYTTSEPVIVEIEVLKRPIISLDCPPEVVFYVGMGPQRIECTATNNLDLDLDYMWRWEPPTLLSETNTSNPLFSVPSQQRPYSYTYPYTVTAWADLADEVDATVRVIVLNLEAESSESVAVSVSELDLGVVGPNGFALLDPATEQISGLLYEGGTTHSGRMTIRAQDSVSVSLELLENATLHHADTPGTLTRPSSHRLNLTPQWAYSESCTRFLANTHTSQTVQSQMTPGDCQMIRLGGEVNLQEAEPGRYTGDIGVVVTVNNVDGLFTIPVVLTVEAEQQVVVLGPTNVNIQPVSANDSALEWEQTITIQPQVAVLSPSIRNGTFQVSNPSIHPMEVAVSTNFGYREARSGTPFSVPVTGDLENLATLISVHPSVVLLLPGETKQVHFAIPEQEFGKMKEQGYAGIFNFTATSRTYIDQNRPIAEQQARITFQAPAVYIPGRGPEKLPVTIVSRTDQILEILIKTDSYPFYGHAVIEDNSGRELGKSEILVYTQSRVQIVLDKQSDDDLTLRFIPHAPNQIIPDDVQIPDDS